MTSPWLEQLKTKLHTWDYLGGKERDGRVIIGYPKRREDKTIVAFLHVYFPGLTDEEIDVIEDKYEVKLSQELRDFYASSNGLGMFNKAVAIYGARSFRMPDGNFIHMLRANLTARKESHQFIIGHKTHFSSEYTYLYLDTQTGLIHHAISNQDLRPRDTWQNLSTLLLNEYERLAASHDEEGHRTFLYVGELERREALNRKVKELDKFNKKYTIASEALTNEWQRIPGEDIHELVEAFEANSAFHEHTVRVEHVEIDIPKEKRRGIPGKETFLVVKPHLNAEQLEHWEGIVEKVIKDIWGNSLEHD